MNLKSAIKRCQQRTNEVLDNYLPDAGEHPHRLHQAMRYSTLDAGKRLRPLLVYSCGEVFSADKRDLDAAAAAVECIHVYSLIHDDLPTMDDDELRRGKATCHIQYDEATAILAGDALQVLLPRLEELVRLFGQRGQLFLGAVDLLLSRLEVTDELLVSLLVVLGPTVDDRVVAREQPVDAGEYVLDRGL